jgi:hypothetical protein
MLLNGRKQNVTVWRQINKANFLFLSETTNTKYIPYSVLAVSFFHTSNNTFKWIEGSLIEPQWIRQQKFTKLFVCNAL